jgi:hypothetical protein
MPRVSKNDRDEMIALRKQGYTYQEIGERYGVSRQRIFQIIGVVPVEPKSLSPAEAALSGSGRRYSFFRFKRGETITIQIGELSISAIILDVRRNVLVARAPDGVEVVITR